MIRKTGMLATPLTTRGAETESFAQDVIAGLSANPKRIPPKYFYDETGCRLFDAICQQPEYALTRTERALMAARLPEIASAVGKVDCIIEPASTLSRIVRYPSRRALVILIE